MKNWQRKKTSFSPSKWVKKKRNAQNEFILTMESASRCFSIWPFHSMDILKLFFFLRFVPSQPLFDSMTLTRSFRHSRLCQFIRRYLCDFRCCKCERMCDLWYRSAIFCALEFSSIFIIYWTELLLHSFYSRLCVHNICRSLLPPVALGIISDRAICV